MPGFKQYLQERFINLVHNDPRKSEYGPEVFSMLQKTYEKLGGIHGTGFRDPEDMAANIPMWKLVKRGNRIVTAVLYKDKEGRKVVASATDGSDEGKAGLIEIFRDDLKLQRSYGERSAMSLSFTKKNLGVDTLKANSLTYDQVAAHFKDKEEIRKPSEDDPEMVRHPEFVDRFYQRKVGDHWHTKLMIGKHGQKIT